MNNDNDEAISIEHLLNIEYRIGVYELVLNEIMAHLRLDLDKKKFDTLKIQALNILQKKYPHMNIKSAELN